MIVFQVESYSAIALDMVPLVCDNHAESGNPLGDRPLDVDYALYLKLERAGLIHVVSARVGDVLVGYVKLTISSDGHHRGVRRAIVDTVYMDPAYRKGLSGFNLLKFAFDSVAKTGVDQIYFSGAVDGRFDKTMKKLGFSKLQTLYGKEV